MTRQLVVLAAALAGLYFVGKRNIIGSIRRAAGFDEVRPGVVAVKDVFGHFVRCETLEGEPLPREACGGCDFPGCPPGSTGQDPGDEYDEDEDSR